MKIKTKLLSVLGATAIAGSSLGLIASCSFKPAPEPEGQYEAPSVVHNGGISFMTKPGEDSCEISDFHLSRDLYLGESVTKVIWEIKQDESTPGIEIENISREYVSANQLKIKVKLKDVAGTYVAQKVVFNVSFIFKYKEEEEQASVVTKDFTLNYTPAWQPNIVKYLGTTEEQKVFESESRGDGSVTVNDLFELDVGLRLNDLHERVHIESTNPYIKAKVLTMKNGDKAIPFTLTVDDSSRIEKHEYNFGLKFIITQDSVKIWDFTWNGFKFIYEPNWRTINVTYEGGSLTVVPNERGDHEAIMEQSFLLSRRLYKDETQERVDVKVENPDGTPIDESIISYEAIPVGDRYYSLKLKYVGPEDNKIKHIKFRVSFTFFDNIGGETELSKTTLPLQNFEADDTNFTFIYTPAWKDNYAEWVGTDTDKCITTQEGVPSTDLGTKTSKLIKLHRNLIPDIESLNVNIISQDNILTLGDWEIVLLDGEYYLWLKDITTTNPQITDVPFDISVEFLENNNVQKISELTGFQFKYLPKADVKIQIPNGRTEAGKPKLSLTASLSEAIAADDDLSADVPDEWEDRIRIDKSVLSDDRKSITFEISLIAITGDAIYEKDIPYDDVYFNMSLGSGPTFPSNNFNITFVKGEIPIIEPEEDYMDDRTFSFVCYEDKGINTIPYTQSAFILSKVLSGNTYEYYVATTWSFKRQYEDVAQKAKTSGNNFVVGVTDSSLQHIHLCSQTKGQEPTIEIKGSKWDDENDYLRFKEPGKEITWENESLFKNKHTTQAASLSSTVTGSANIFVGKVNFQSIVDKNPNGWFKEKLDLLNNWQVSTKNPTKTINNFLPDDEGAVLQDQSDNDYNNFYIAGYPTYNYYFSKTATKTEPITVFDKDMYFNDEAVVPGAQPTRNRQTFYPYYYQTAQRSWNHLKYAIEAPHFLNDVNHVCPSYHTMTGDASGWGNPYWFGQLLSDVGYLSPGSMMVARNRNKNNQLYLLGMYVGCLVLKGDYKYLSDHDLPGAYYMPWFDSYVNHNDEKWSDVSSDTHIDIFYRYREDNQ